MDAAILMYGNLCVVGAVGIWLLLATYLEMPVSTTHSCVGGLIGMGLVTKGGSCITWYKEPDNANDKFLPGGVTGIVLSWVFSPVLSGVMAVIIYSLVRRFVLRSADSFNRAIKVSPRRYRPRPPTSPLPRCPSLLPAHSSLQPPTPFRRSPAASLHQRHGHPHTPPPSPRQGLPDSHLLRRLDQRILCAENLQ